MKMLLLFSLEENEKLDQCFSCMRQEFGPKSFLFSQVSLLFHCRTFSLSPLLFPSPQTESRISEKFESILQEGLYEWRTHATVLCSFHRVTSGSAWEDPD